MSSDAVVAGLEKQRARSEDDKLVRRATIVAAALELLRRRSHHEITMAEVARAADLAKGTVYLYFPTKEALLLAVFERAMVGLLDDVIETLTHHRYGDPESFARFAVDCIDRHPVFASLTMSLHQIIERNVELDRVIAFKQTLLANLVRAGQVIERQLPFLRPGQGAHLFLRVHALYIGVRQLSDPAPIMHQAIERPELAALRIDFATEFIDVLISLLRGMEQRAKEESHGQPASRP